MKNYASLFGHLAEMRRRLFAAALCWLGGIIICWIYWQEILDIFLIWPLHLLKTAPKIIYSAPAEAVTLSIKIGVYGGLLLAAPVILYQIWAFLAPGLYKHEKKIILPAAFVSTLMFALGLIFCYLIIPHLMFFFTQYSGGRLEALLRVDLYLSFIFQMLLAFGLTFEMPVVAYVLAKMGIVSAGMLWQAGRFAIVGIFIIAAIFSPPDVFSQMVMAVPLLLLYALSILVAKLSYPKENCQPGGD